MARLTAQLATQFTESVRLEAVIRENLRGIGQDFALNKETTPLAGGVGPEMLSPAGFYLHSAKNCEDVNKFDDKTTN